MLRTTPHRRRIAREIVPGLVGLGAVAVLTLVSSHNALGVQSPAPTPATTCASHGHGACPVQLP